MTVLQSILEKYGVAHRAQPDSDHIHTVEEKIGFKLPEDYKGFLEGYAGFEEFIGKEFVKLWDVEELMEINQGYQIITELENTVGIGSNGSGEFIAIEKGSAGEFRVVLSPFIDLDLDCHIEIGSSFTDFLQRLEDGHEWFNED